jgi:large subunit ribosomal protein L6
MKVEKLEANMELPEGVEASVKNNTVTIKGPKGELTRTFTSKRIDATLGEKEIMLVSLNATKKEKKLIFTFRAHINNMIAGVTKGFVYKLKVCSGHFPMNVALNGGKFVIKNFIGEKKPREFIIKEGAKVTINGADITVEGINKEIVGQTAADIEQLTNRPHFDKRKFQDGIYIIEKNGKAM